MTLIELVVAVSLMGLIATVIGAAITVTFRQQAATEGRVNVARGEQSIDTWIPADLASTDTTADFEALYGPAYAGLTPVDTAPDASPCGNCGGLDLSGSNALQLAWFTAAADGSPILTRVQYQYIQIAGEWQLQRVQCVGAEPCTAVTVLHDLDGPPDPGTYNPDTDSPTWVISTGAPPDDGVYSTNAQQFQVTINGGGTNGGAGGGTNAINLTAGGVATGDIAADDFTVPSFVRAKSRCGGPVTLIIDDSGSIGGAVDTVVEPGVLAFIEAFRGTPTQLQVIQFSSKARALGPVTTDPTGWHRYVDMTNDTLVDQLKTAVLVLDSSGNTNWEDGFFHALKNSDGSPATVLPNRIVFFTDGIPNRNRASSNGAWQDAYSNGAKFIDYNAGTYRRTGVTPWPNEGSGFHQESYDRADVILDGNRGTDLIFVGVGPGLNDNISWIYNQDAYTNPNVSPSPAVTKKASDAVSGLLSNLVPAAVVPATLVGGVYTNPEVANFYLQSNFDAAQFGAAMRASALKDCGGTLTVQTRLPDGTPVGDEFVYENSEYRDDTGAVVSTEPRVVTTSSSFRTGTFDFDIPPSTDYFSVDVVPQGLETLTGYAFGGWSCRAGGAPKGITPIPITDSTFQGFTVDVAANAAVSCILTVTPS
jgi:hypothetical protein